MTRVALRSLVLGYLAVLVVFPVGWIVWEAFGLDAVWTAITSLELSRAGHSLAEGVGGAWSAGTTPFAVHALFLTLLISMIVVVINTVFGVMAALMIVRHPFPGVSVVSALVDLPIGLSPVVVGLCLILLYGDTGWFGPWLQSHGITVIFSLPGMILATIIVTLPFVVREVVPVVREVGTGQEEAARTLGASASQTFWQITLPAIRAGVVYGVVLTMARALGEFGALSVVSSTIPGVSETLTLFIDDANTNGDLRSVYVASVELAVLAVLTLIFMNLIRRKGAV